MNLIKSLAGGLKNFLKASKESHAFFLEQERLRREWYKEEIIKAFEHQDWERAAKLQEDVNLMRWTEYEKCQKGEFNGCDISMANRYL